MTSGERHAAVMHRVRPGECFRSIAAAYGIDDWRALYEHERNAALRGVRPNPHVLAPGDIVYVPAREPPVLQFSSGSEQRYKATIPKVAYRLVVKDAAGQALAGKPYVLRVGEARFESTLPNNGLLEHEISALATEAKLELDLGEDAGGVVVIPLRIGHLDPVDTVRGAQSRLFNLGIACPASGRLDEATRAALAQFQRREGLAVTGELDAETRERLEAKHHEEP